MTTRICVECRQPAFFSRVQAAQGQQAGLCQLHLLLIQLWGHLSAGPQAAPAQGGHPPGLGRGLQLLQGPPPAAPAYHAPQVLLSCHTT